MSWLPVLSARIDISQWLAKWTKIILDLFILIWSWVPTASVIATNSSKSRSLNMVWHIYMHDWCTLDIFPCSMCAHMLWTNISQVTCPLWSYHCGFQAKSSATTRTLISICWSSMLAMGTWPLAWGLQGTEQDPSIWSTKVPTGIEHTRRTLWTSYQLQDFGSSVDLLR